MDTEITEQNAADRASDRRIVVVELNGDPRRIPAGHYTGRELKQALDVPIEHELDQVVDGKFDPVGNDEKVRIKGGEKFVAHCGQGQSS